jgi:hypothetical protein
MQKLQEHIAVSAELLQRIAFEPRHNAGDQPNRPVRDRLGEEMRRIGAADRFWTKKRKSP